MPAFRFPPKSRKNPRSTCSMTNVFLIGYRGTGKTTIAPLLAQSLGWQPMDTDQLVMAKAAKSIAEIFRTAGEERFRDLESEILAELARGSNQVVSTGGGIILREPNRQLLRQHGWVVWLQSSPEVILRRLQED